jgi:hypothetical protein
MSVDDLVRLGYSAAGASVVRAKRRRPMRWHPMLATLALVVAWQSGFARNLTLDVYLKERQAEPQRGYDLIWLDGLYNGLLMASIEMSLDRKGELFCPPEHMTMTTEQIADILDRYIAKNLGKMPPDPSISIVLLAAMKETFPCR